MLHIGERVRVLLFWTLPSFEDESITIIDFEVMSSSVRIDCSRKLISSVDFCRQLPRHSNQSSCVHFGRPKVAVSCQFKAPIAGYYFHFLDLFVA